MPCLYKSGPWYSKAGALVLDGQNPWPTDCRTDLDGVAAPQSISELVLKVFQDLQAEARSILLYEGLRGVCLVSM